MTCVSAPRRRFIRTACVAMAAGWCVRAFGQPVTIDVRGKGAVGDGVTDDTAAFQAAIDALPASGGTVHVAAGDYRIDATRSVRLRSHAALVLDEGAVLRALPNASERSQVILIDGVQGVSVTGGLIKGERDTHQGTTGEWGHGIYIHGASSVDIRGVTISGCWGDGICIGAIRATGMPVRVSSDIRIQRVACTGNRRQGLSIGPSSNVTVTDCEFSGTQGTAPSAGIDIEPEAPQQASGVVIQRCKLLNNHGPGIQVYVGAVGARVEDCQISGNGAAGVLVVGAVDTAVRGSTVQSNTGPGIWLKAGASGSIVTGNRLGVNGPRKTAAAPASSSSAPAPVEGAPTSNAIRVDSDTRGTQVSGNTALA